MRVPSNVMLCLALTARVVAAQSRPLSDSVAALNRAGKWELAGKLAVTGMRATVAQCRCRANPPGSTPEQDEEIGKIVRLQTIECFLAAG